MVDKPRVWRGAYAAKYDGPVIGNSYLKIITRLQFQLLAHRGW